MKSIIASIHPNWLAEIKAGYKTIEVRKSRPLMPVKYIFWHITGQKGIAGYSKIKSGGIWSWCLADMGDKTFFIPIPTKTYHPAQEIKYKRAPQWWQYCDTPEGM